MMTYEQVSEALEQLSVPAGDAEIATCWVVPDLLAVAKDRNGRYVALIEGPPLVPSLPSTSQAMRYSTWRTTSGLQITANVIVLPGAPEFRAAVAAIVAELLRAGIRSDNTGSVFSGVEPFIELVIRKVLLPPDAVLGLLGELYLLSEVIDALPAKSAISTDPTKVWQGWTRSVRDFDLGRVAIEVKTTRGQSARHTIRGLDQVEPRLVDGAAVEQLYLASIGLRATDDPGPITVARLTSRILSRLASTWREGDPYSDAQSKFLSRLASYGPVGSTGYRHDEMRLMDIYAQAYTTTFPPALYYLNDTNLLLIRRATLVGTCVRADSVSYDVDLPQVVPGSIDNPRYDLKPALVALCKQLGKAP